MLTGTLLSFALLFSHAAPRAAQSPAPPRPAEKTEAAPPQDAAAPAQPNDAGARPQPDEPAQKEAEEAAQKEEAAAQRRRELLAELRALESESRELLRPTDAASARAEIADAAWALDRAWAKALLREALPLTFPAEVDRPRLRERAVGAPLQPRTPEDAARARVRGRILKIAARDRDLSRELNEITARELGKVEEVYRGAALAGAAAAEGRVEEAGELIMRAAEAEPTLINIGTAINEVAARDRAAADRLILGYIERLRALPLSLFTARNHTPLRIPLSFTWMLRPDSMGFPTDTPPPPPPGREVVRAYISFVVDTMTRIEQSHGDLTGMHIFVVSAWPHMMQHAPEFAAQLGALERASRRGGAGASALRTFDEIKETYGRRYEERLKIARQTKDPLDLEVAASSAAARKEFEEARKLIGLLKEGVTKSQLTESVNTKEALHLLGAGDLAGAERLARQLEGVSSMRQVYPPLVGRLAKGGDADRAVALAEDAARRMRAAAERNPSDDNFIPTLLAPLAGSIRVFKQTRALEALGELALAVEPAAPQTALGILDALADTALKARVTSEDGNPNFNPDAFARLWEADAGRVRSAAARFEDRLQRVAALAAACRGEAARLAEMGPRATKLTLR